MEHILLVCPVINCLRTWKLYRICFWCHRFFLCFTWKLRVKERDSLSYVLHM